MSAAMLSLIIVWVSVGAVIVSAIMFAIETLVWQKQEEAEEENVLPVAE